MKNIKYWRKNSKLWNIVTQCICDKPSLAVVGVVGASLSSSAKSSRVVCLLKTGLIQMAILFWTEFVGLYAQRNLTSVNEMKNHLFLIYCEGNFMELNNCGLSNK